MTSDLPDHVHNAEMSAFRLGGRRGAAPAMRFRVADLINSAAMTTDARAQYFQTAS